MKQLSEKTGREKIELMLIWPLAYHPAGEIWQTSAVHATAVNHFVTLQTFICIVLACSRGRRRNPELNQRSVCSVVCLPTTHWKLLVNTQTLLWGILEENIHLLHSNTQRCVWNWAENKKKADTRHRSSCVRYPRSFQFSGVSGSGSTCWLFGQRKGAATWTKAVKRFNSVLMENFISCNK